MAELIYQAGFNNRDPLDPLQRPPLWPVVDRINGKAMHLTQAPDLSVQPTKEFLESPAGLRLTLERTVSAPTKDLGGATKDDCYFGAVVNPFPGDIKHFKIRATFELPELLVDPSETYGWAMAIFARTGDAAYWPTRDERITITLRSSNRSGKPLGFLNNPGGEPRFTEQIPATVFEGIFKSHDAERSTFTIELLIDRTDKVARAGLDCRIYPRSDPPPPPDVPLPYSKRRWFRHPLVPSFRLRVSNDTGINRHDPDIVRGDTIEASSIDSVGFAIGIASGKATASATIRDFRIYRLSKVEIGFLRLEIWRLRLLLWVKKWLPPWSHRSEGG